MDFINQLQIPGAVVQIASLVLGVLFLVFLTLTIVLAVKNHILKDKIKDSANEVNGDNMALRHELEFMNSMNAGTIVELRKEVSTLKCSYRKIAMKDAIFIHNPHLTGEKDFGSYIQTAQKIYKFYAGREATKEITD